jgi:hypothetical protein
MTTTAVDASLVDPVGEDVVYVVTGHRGIRTASRVL